MRILYVASVVKTHIMQFHIAMFKALKEQGCVVDVIAKNDYNNCAEHLIPYCDHYYDVPIGRNPFCVDNLKAYKEIGRIINSGHYDIIHCHTPVASVLTRLAAREARKSGTRVIYTAHGFHFYKGAPFVNWMLFYPAEKLCSRFTDTIITINREDYDFAVKKLKARRVEFVRGVGVDLLQFNFSDSEKEAVRKKIREEFSIPCDAFVITYVGELIKRKNQKLIIGLMKELPDHMHLLIVGDGKLHGYLKNLVEEKGLSDRILFTGYRRDIPNIYAATDLCIMTSFQEGLPVALMEGMASGIPCLASDIRGCRDLLGADSGMLMRTDQPEEWKKAILDIYENKELAAKYGALNRELIKKFDIHDVNDQLCRIYFEQ